MSFGNKIRVRREKLNLTIQELSHKCSVPSSVIRDIENNNCNPSLSTFDNIASALGMSISLKESAHPKVNVKDILNDLIKYIESTEGIHLYGVPLSRSDRDFLIGYYTMLNDHIAYIVKQKKNNFSHSG